MFTETDRAQVAAAISAAEAGTSGEIVCIVSETRHAYTGFALGIALFAASLVPLAAVILGVDFNALLPGAEWSSGDATLDLRHGIEAYAAVQALLFVVIAALLTLTRLGHWLVPRFVRHHRVHSAALTQFRARGIADTRAHTGVLIYVDSADRIAEVVADSGIYAKVSPSYWRTTVDALLRGLRAGTPAQGFVDAVALAGAVLAEHFPARSSDNPNELPDRLIVL